MTNSTDAIKWGKAKSALRLRCHRRAGGDPGRNPKGDLAIANLLVMLPHDAVVCKEGRQAGACPTSLCLTYFGLGEMPIQWMGIPPAIKGVS